MIKLVIVAHDNKPKFGDTCNNCGWCCLTEVCAIGEELQGNKELPCNYLITDNDKHTCKLASVPQLKKQLSIGNGCDAKTQAEIIEELTVK